VKSGQVFSSSIINTPSLKTSSYFLCEFHDSFSFPPGLNELHCSLSIGGIPLLILATQETQCVGKSGGISPVSPGTHSVSFTVHCQFSGIL
jgi:hypothetical protein